jgi:small GTP-binding protein
MGEQDITLKILLIGDTYVGKTSLLLQYIDRECPENHMATIGVEFRDKIIQIDNKKVKLQVWDTSGQERYRSITKNFYRNADGVMFVCDVTKEKTFDNIKNWLIDSEQNANNSNFKKILVGNKIDLKEERAIDTQQLQNFANKKEMNFYETSAKDGTNVDHIFTELAKLILEDKSDQQIKEEFSHKNRSLSVYSKESEESNNPKKKKGCC